MSSRSMEERISTKWDDTSWQEEFLGMKTYKPEEVRVQMESQRIPRRLKKRYEQLKLQKNK